LADPISPYLDLIKFIVERFDSYISKEQRKKEMEAARVLKYANILTVSLRQLDNSFKSETRKLRTLKANASNSEREEIEYRVRKFAEDEDILPNIEDAAGKLDSFTRRFDEEYVPLVKELVEKGNGVIMCARGAGDFTTCLDEPEMDQLLQEMHQVRDEDAAEGERQSMRDARCL
jgi:hypothetical protein